MDDNEDTIVKRYQGPSTTSQSPCFRSTNLSFTRSQFYNCSTTWSLLSTSSRCFHAASTPKTPMRSATKQSALAEPQADGYAEALAMCSHLECRAIATTVSVHGRHGVRSPRSTITRAKQKLAGARLEEALKAGEGPDSQRPVYPAESEQASDSAALPPGPNQTPASVEGPVGSPVNRTPGTVMYMKAVDCDGSSVSMPSVGRYHGLPEEHRSPESGNRPLPELVIDEQEHWRQQQGGGEALAAPAVDGAFLAYRRNTTNPSRACLTFVVLVIVVMSCFIIGTRLAFLAKWSPPASLN
ncbi:hypothetical protein MRX96_040776 [Rhipicephalus microplus]